MIYTVYVLHSIIMMCIRTKTLFFVISVHSYDFNSKAFQNSQLYYYHVKKNLYMFSKLFKAIKLICIIIHFHFLFRMDDP